MIWLFLTIILGYYLYIVLIKPLSYWKDRKVPHNKPWPIIGNMYSFLAKKQSIYNLVMDSYSEFQNERFYGIFHFQQPILFIRDLDVTKQILIQDFSFFVNRTTLFSGDTDPIMSKNLLNLKDEKWRKMRATLSPSFTGSKMKFLFNLVSDCATQFTTYFESLDPKIIEVEMKNIFGRFANDVIATSAFGISTDSLNQKDNEFFQKSKKTINFKKIQGVYILLRILFHPLKKVLNVSIYEPSLVTFFQRIITETIASREKNNTVRLDMIHLLLEARKKTLLVDHDTTAKENFLNKEEDDNSPSNAVQKTIITDKDIAAQAILFFSAGLETMSTLSSFMSYELALNRDVQKKLQAEIDQVAENCDGRAMCDQIVGMKYLDMVVSESLRKWPPAMVLDRVCGRDYVIEGKTENEKSIIIEKGISITVPTLAIHRDPDYFPNPDQFDPERFSDENKHKIVPFSYMPFGLGPRNCIAFRFALMEVKIMFYHLLLKFDIVPTGKTQIPLIISKSKTSLGSDEGFWLGFQKRNLSK